MAADIGVRGGADIDVSGECVGFLPVDDVDLFVHHQANSRIIEAVGRQLGPDRGRVVDVVARVADAPAASIPVALSAARDEGRLGAGDRVPLGAFGAGLVGGTILTWGRCAATPGAPALSRPPDAPGAPA